MCVKTRVKLRAKQLEVSTLIPCAALMQLPYNHGRYITEQQHSNREGERDTFVYNGWLQAMVKNSFFFKSLFYFYNRWHRFALT